MRIVKRYYKGIKRRMQKWECRRAYESSPKPFANAETTYATLCFDYEGKYSGALNAKEQDAFSRRGIQHILAELESAEIKATFNCVGRLVEDHPDILKQIAESGHEIASHTVEHIPVDTWSDGQMATDMMQFRKMMQPFAGNVTGFRGPQSKWTRHSLDGLLKANVLWNAEDDPAPYPYIIRRNNGRNLWRMPVRIDDWAMEAENLPPDQMLAKWLSAVKVAIKHKHYVAIGFHPWVLGKSPDRLRAFNMLIRHSSFDVALHVQPFNHILKLCQNNI